MCFPRGLTIPPGVLQDGQHAGSFVPGGFFRQACEALAAWDGRSDKGSRGVHLFEEFVTRLPTVPLDLVETVWRTPFDPEEPLSTPRERALSTYGRRLIYRDLRRRTGAVVFSSSLGHELSLESDAWRNGAFTEALLEALSSGDPGPDGGLLYRGSQAGAAHHARRAAGDCSGRIHALQ